MTRPAPTAPLRVALVIGHLGFGGAERQLTELALRLHVHGFEPTVFCLGGTEEPFGTVLRRAGIAVEGVRRRHGFDLRRAGALSMRLRAGAFDVVHSFLANANPYAWLAARVARAPVFIASNRNADYPRGPVRATIDALAFRGADAIVVNAEAVRSFTARRFGLPRERIRVIRNGVDLERFRPPAGYDGNAAPTIGTIGSLTPKKNPELFAEMCAALRARLPEVRCLHAGEGPLRDPLERRHGGTVGFLGACDAAENFLATLDVFVLTSTHEGCPNVLLEAMACARPCVATDAGGVREILEDDVTGFVVAPGDRDGLVTSVFRLLADSSLRTRIGAAARARVERDFTLPGMVSAVAEVYRNCLARRAA